MRQPPSIFSARVFRLAASEPVSGSVSPKQPRPRAGAQVRQPALLLLLGPPADDRRADERGHHRDHGPHRGVVAADLLDDQAIGHVVRAAAAVLLGDDRAEEAHVGHLLDELGVEMLVAVVLAGSRSDLLVAEFARRFADQFLLVSEFEVDHVFRILQDAGDRVRERVMELPRGARDRPRPDDPEGHRRGQPLRGLPGLGRAPLQRHGRQGAASRPRRGGVRAARAAARDGGARGARPPGAAAGVRLAHRGASTRTWWWSISRAPRCGG